MLYGKLHVRSYDWAKPQPPVPVPQPQEARLFSDKVVEVRHPAALRLEWSLYMAILCLGYWQGGRREAALDKISYLQYAGQWTANVAV